MALKLQARTSQEHKVWTKLTMCNFCNFCILLYLLRLHNITVTFYGIQPFYQTFKLRTTGFQ